MDTIKLPPRLSVIAEMVPCGTKLADVGTDHGLVPIFLLQSGRIRSSAASDIRPGPLSRARANAESHGIDNIRFVLCDGLAGISPEEADTIVIAGMGGETIAAILAAAPWVKSDKTLILQPMSRPEVLRGALGEQRLRIEEERLVEDGGKLYTILRAGSGEPRSLSEAERYIGPVELLSGQELFPAWLDQWERKIRKMLKGLSRSARPEDGSRRDRWNTVLEQLVTIREGGW